MLENKIFSNTHCSNYKAIGIQSDGNYLLLVTPPIIY
nr:MAG TPA: hypothetical protein [Caudoviricetes sp.]